MFELNNTMKVNAAKIFAELIKTKYDEAFLLTVLEDMGDSNCYSIDNITINGTEVECYKNVVRTYDSEENADYSEVSRAIVIIVTEDEKAILADLTTKIQFKNTNGVFEIEDSSAEAHEISIAEALELWKD